MYTKEQANKAMNLAILGIDIKQNQEIVIDSQDYQSAYLFAINVKEADIERLEQVIINGESPEFIFKFALISLSNNINVNLRKLGYYLVRSNRRDLVEMFYQTFDHSKFDAEEFETHLTFS